jgi:Coenzyme PQQ synthesis protein D (PqqD)
LTRVRAELTRIPVPAEGVASRLVDGVAIALTEGDHTLHTFDGPVSTFIWTLIDGRRTLDQILNQVLSAFEVERQRALDDLLQFVELLQERGLIAVAANDKGS